MADEPQLEPLEAAGPTLSWRAYLDADRPEWDRFVDQCRTPLFFFRRDFMEYHKARFADGSMMLFDGSAIAAVLPATVHDDTLVSHGGLTFGGLLLGPRIKAATVLEALTALTEVLAARGIRKLVYKAIPYIFDRQPAQDDLYALHRLGARIVRRDVSSVIHLDARLKLSKGRKWMIARARKEGLSVTPSTDWLRFHGLVGEALSRHGAAPVHTVEELKLLAGLFPERLQLYVIERDGRLIAATLLFIFDGVVHTQYIATNEAGKALGALDFLIEELIERFAASGVRYFSFGISTEEQGRVLNEGLIAQKEGFGARGMAVDFYELNTVPVPSEV